MTMPIIVSSAPRVVFKYNEEVHLPRSAYIASETDITAPQRNGSTSVPMTSSSLLGDGLVTSANEAEVRFLCDKIKVFYKCL